MLKIHYSLESDAQNIINDITAPAELNIQVRNKILKLKKGRNWLQVSFWLSVLPNMAQLAVQLFPVRPLRLTITT